MEPLTPKQQDVLLYISDARTGRGVSPTRREIATAFGMSINNVQQYLAALRRKGYVTLTAHAHRSIRLARDRREWTLQRTWRNDFERAVGSRLQAATDLPPLFTIVREEVRSWLGVDRAELFVHDAHRRELRDAAFYEAGAAGLAGEIAAVPADGASELAFRRGRTVLATETEEPDLLRRERERRPGLAACAAVPLKDAGGVRGVLLLDELVPGSPDGPSAALRVEPGGFDGVKLARAALAASSLAQILGPATLNAELQRRIRLQAALVALCRTINTSGDFQSIVGDIYDIVKSLIDAPYFIIAVLDREGRSWILLETDTADGRTVANPRPHLAGKINNPAIEAIKTRPYYILHRTPEQVAALEAQGPGRAREGWRTIGHPKRSRSLLFVPLRSEGGVIGRISAQSYRYNAYTMRDVEDLLLMGEYIGLALRNAWRMREDRKRREAERRTRERVDRAKDRLRKLAAALDGRPRAALRSVIRDLTTEEERGLGD